MEATTANARPKPGLVLRRAKLDELRRANNIATEAELARILGVSNQTLWRASDGNPVSGMFVAQVIVAFPHVQMGDLFEVIVPTPTVSAAAA